MSTSQQLLVFDSSTLANFKQWAQAISSFMTTAGWTQTTDTGQVNWSTISTVPAANAFVYEIWQPSSDPLQTGSTAYFLRINYGKTNESPAGPRFQVAIGTGTDGAGNLTGLVTSFLDGADNGPTGTGSIGYECDFSGDTTRVSIGMFRNVPSSSMPQFFAVERTKNTDGSNSSDGICLMMMSNSTGTQGITTIVFGQGVTTPTLRALPFLGVNNSTDQFLNSIPASPLFPDYGKFGNPLTSMAGVPSGIVISGMTFQIQLYSATRTYMCFGTQALNSPGSIAWCMRYD
jgi:hypothetical protein